MEPVTIARENATLREELLRRRLTTEAELDRIGYVSHADLDLWEQAGVLGMGVRGLQEAWGLGLLHGDIFNRRVLRGRGGKFAGVIGEKEAKPSERRIRHSAGSARFTRTEHPQARGGDPIATLSKGGRTRRVHATPRPGWAGPPSGSRRPDAMSSRQFHDEAITERDLHQAGHERLSRMAQEHRNKGADLLMRDRPGDQKRSETHYAAADKLEAAKKDRAQLAQHGTAELYEKRGKNLERRVKRRVKRAGTEEVTPAARGVRGEHDLSAAEVHFNDAGHVSQKTLLAYVEDAASQPTTAEMYRDKEGNYHPSRKALHDHIIDKLMRQHAVDEKGGDGGLTSDRPLLQPPASDPTVMFTGGGYAAGKGGVVKMLKAKGEWPQDALLLDPDLIKAELPEFQAGAMTDPEANLRVYTEAWDIAQAALKQAQEKGLNVVVDGITNSSSDEVAKRVKTFTDARPPNAPNGYTNPRIFYVSVPTNEAIRRAQKRAEGAKTPADRRMIPETIMRAVHRDVSATIPNVMAKAKDMGAHVEVYDTDQGLDDVTGRPNPPKLVAVADPAEGIHYPDRSAYEAIQHKANETISGVPGVQGPEQGVWQTGGQVVTINPSVERTIGQETMTQLPEGLDKAPKQPQPVSDPAELLALAEAKGLPGFQALLDLGHGVGEVLGADIHDASRGKDFGQIGQDIAANMDKPHVIIAPVKSEKSARSKMIADQTPDDWSHLHDAIRATVTVPTGQDLPKAIASIRQELEKRGWTMERVKPRLVSAKGNNRNGNSGYGDTSLILRGPKEAGGMTAELQVSTNPMWWTKELGPGHAYYELERQISRAAMAQNRDETPGERALLERVQKAARPLYDNAWGASLNGGITGSPGDVVMGNEVERKRAQKELADLTRETEALMSSGGQAQAA